MNDENKAMDANAIDTEATETVEVEFVLSNNRKVNITVNGQAIVQNVQSLQQDINKLLNIIQNVICVDDEHRTQVQNEAINAASSYLVNVNIPLVDYFHMDVDDYRLATTMTMDAIVAYNTLIVKAQDITAKDNPEPEAAPENE
jgi:hypothetical protein